MRTEFPSRQVLARLREKTAHPAGDDLFSARILGTDDEPSASPSNLFRFIVGDDAQPVAMSVADAEALGDVFSREILLKGQNPLTLRDLDQAVAAVNAPALPMTRMFLVAEGAQFAAAGKVFELNARLVFTWQESAAKAPDILLSTVAAANDTNSLLQLISWSDHAGAFQFYERTGGAWVWAGSSFHALMPASRGKGPFDSHINGGLVMKELKAPWTHWHSMSGTISREVFGADSEFNQDPLFAELDGAEQLEQIVRTGLRRWTKARIAADLRQGVLKNLPDYLRQLLWCTSVNLASSRDGFDSNETEFDLPTSFFYDVDAISAMARKLDPTADVIPQRPFKVSASSYRAAVAAAGIAVIDVPPAATSIAGDTHFAFLVPERAFEDLVVVNELVTQGVLSPRLALCLLMVDFTNPVFSPARALLFRFVPAEVAAGDGGSALDQRFVAAVRQAGPTDAGPEAEFLDLWDRDDLVSHVAELLAAFHGAVEARLQTPDGIADVLDLAESRRDVVRKLRSLAEFSSTLAQGSSPPQHLAMARDGSNFVKPSTGGEGEL